MPLRFQDDFLKKLEYLQVVSRREFAGRNRADRRTPKKGRGIEFADHRQYARGDDFRHIDWKAYKRVNRLLLRLFEEEQDLPIYLILDVSGSMAEEAKFDLARKIAAALCYVGLVHLDHLTMLTFAQGLVHESSPGRGTGRIFRVFEQLERLEAAGPTDLRESLKAFASRPRPVGLTVIISDFMDPSGFEAGLKILPDHDELLAVRKELGVRSKPLVPFLDRSHPINVTLGQTRHAKKVAVDAHAFYKMEM